MSPCLLSFADDGVCMSMPCELNELHPRVGRSEANVEDNDCCCLSCDMLQSHASDMGTRFSCTLVLPYVSCFICRQLC